MSTKRVWGMGPSAASTSSSTPSTMFITRSTSPPKSAWPGVSTMLIFTCLLVSGSQDIDSGILGQDGDATLAFQRVRVHHPLDDLLVLAENPRLSEQAIHQGRLPVVNVSDNGNVSEVGSFDQHNTLQPIFLVSCKGNNSVPNFSTQKPRPAGPRLVGLQCFYLIRGWPFWEGVSTNRAGLTRPLLKHKMDGNGQLIWISGTHHLL